MMKISTLGQIAFDFLEEKLSQMGFILVSTGENSLRFRYPTDPHGINVSINVVIDPTLNYLDLASKLFTRVTCIAYLETEDEPEIVLREERGQALILLMEELFGYEFTERVFREDHETFVECRGTLTAEKIVSIKSSKNYERLRQAMDYVAQEFIFSHQEFDLTSHRWGAIKNKLQEYLARRNDGT
jgi:hypothetical protein